MNFHPRAGRTSSVLLATFQGRLEMIPERLEQLYEGKAKRVFRSSDPALYIVEYKDDATAFNGVKKAQISGKGVINNAITARLFPLLEREGVPTHFVSQLSEREQLVKAVTIIPVEVIVRNLAAGSFAKRLGLEEGLHLSIPVLEHCYKSDELGDPLVSRDAPIALGWCSEDDLETIRLLALRVNSVLTGFFLERGVRLVDFKLEFGKLASGQVILADEISPDTCRFWDAVTGEKLDKDRFRRDLGGVEEAYADMLERVMAASPPQRAAGGQAR